MSFQGEDFNDSDGEHENYSHLDSSNIGTITSNPISNETENKLEEKKRNESINNAQLELMKNRLESLKNYMPPVVVPTTTSQIAQTISTPVIVSSPIQQVQQYNGNNSQSSYIPPSNIFVQEINHPNFTLKQYTDKSFIVRAGPSVSADYFRDYASYLHDDRLKGSFIRTPKDNGAPGWCYANYNYAKVVEILRAIVGRVLQPKPALYSSAANNTFSQRPTMSSITQIPTTQTQTPIVPTLPENKQRIIIDVLKPSVGNILTLKSDQVYPIQISSVDPPDNGIIVSAQAIMQNGARIQLKLINYKWQIPGYSVSHEIY
jgi:hypothetical protein